MNKIPMELRQLEYFRMAAKMRNLTRAAAELKVSQPNITVAIQKLETSLGLRLFDRSQKQFLLTAEGENFLRRVEDSLNLLHDALRDIGARVGDDKVGMRGVRSLQHHVH